MRLRSTPIALLLATVGLAAVPARADVTGSGRIVDETRSVGDFTAISVAAGIQVKVEAGPRSALALRGEDNVLPHVRTEIKGSTLQIGFEPNLSMSTRQPVVIALRAPRLDELGASGGSLLDAATPTGASLRIAASGGSRVHLSASVKPRRLDIDSSGASEITIDEVEVAEARIGTSGAGFVSLAGTARSLDLQLSGAARLDASRLTVSALKVEGSGGSRARVHVVGTAEGSISGGTTLHVGADASVAVSSTGGSSVQREL